ncbi:MAG: ribose-phosphate pyrophosphokinase [Arcobacter sp.]|nr:ribose-phosphate pyrophosphokinase [Arcobacter sp.]
MSIYVNGKEIKSFNFSGGECHIKIISSDITDNTNILAKLHSSDAVMQLFMVVDAVRRVKPDTKIKLTIPYFPYARQDRVCNEGESFSAKVMANLINQLNCKSVTVYDPHSQVIVDALNNVNIVSLSDIVCSSIIANKIIKNGITIVSPDKGAYGKIKLVSQSLKAEVISASKVRDTKTGNITDTSIIGNVLEKDCIILDDICDGGRTFIELSKVLSSNGAGKIYLYVTHGIFSKGLEVLKNHFNHIYCYHSMLPSEQIDSTFLTIFNVEKHIKED